MQKLKSNLYFRFRNRLVRDSIFIAKMWQKGPNYIFVYTSRSCQSILCWSNSNAAVSVDSMPWRWWVYTPYHKFSTFYFDYNAGIDYNVYSSNVWCLRNRISAILLCWCHIHLCSRESCKIAYPSVSLNFHKIEKNENLKNENVKIEYKDRNEKQFLKMSKF